MRALVALALVFVVASAPSTSAYGPGRTLCALPAPIVESSGIIASSRSDDVFFTHNDSGDAPRFFAVDRSCRLLATIDVTGASAVDWEDIARGPAAGGGSAVFLGDIGDNNAVRSSVTVYEVPEPVIDTGTTGAHLKVAATAHTFSYDDGPHDAETLLIDPAGRIIVVTKAIAGSSRIYVGSGGRLQSAGSIDVAKLASPPPAFGPPLVVAGRLAVTGGDVSPDGSKVVLRTYAEAFEWTVVKGDVVQAFTGVPQVVALPAEPQGEGIAYTRDGRGLVTTTEGAGGALDLIPAAPAATPGTRPSSSGTVSEHTGTAPNGSPWRVVLTVTAVVVLVAGGAVVAMRRRRRASASGGPDGR